MTDETTSAVVIDERIAGGMTAERIARISGITAFPEPLVLFILSMGGSISMEHCKNYTDEELASFLRILMSNPW